MSRFVRITRDSSINLKLTKYTVLIDGIVSAELKDGQSIDIPIDTNAHTINLIVAKVEMPIFHISAGTQSPLLKTKVGWNTGAIANAWQGKKSLKDLSKSSAKVVTLELNGVIENDDIRENSGKLYEYDNNALDTFLRDIIKAMDRMFSGQGVMDRIKSPNNARHDLSINFFSDHFELSYEPVKTQGAQQWLTNTVIEKVYYEQIGISVPSNLPPNWEETTKRYVIAFVVNENRFNIALNKYGAFIENKMHSLF